MAPREPGLEMKRDVAALCRRMKQFGLRVIRAVESLPSTRTAGVLGGQLLRAATSVGANYRAACRARSPAEFLAKMGIIEEELDESIYWLELLVEADLMPAHRLADLIEEANELLAITVASIRTARRNHHSPARRQKNEPSA